MKRMIDNGWEQKTISFLLFSVFGYKNSQSYRARTFFDCKTSSKIDSENKFGGGTYEVHETVQAFL
jgi:hypothetical protein